MSELSNAEGRQRSQEPTPKRRNRRINTCVECQRLKRKCSRTLPCSNCQKTSRQCVFPTSPWRKTSTPHDSTTPSSVQSDYDPRYRYGSNLFRESSNVSGQAEHTPEICLRIGKMTLGERIGGVLRTNTIDTLDTAIQLGEIPSEQTDQYSAPIIAWFKPLKPLPLGQLFSVDSSPPAQLAFNASQEKALLDQYFSAVHPVCHVVSMSDLELPEAVIRPLRIALFYAAAVSLPLLESQRLFDTTKELLVKTLKAATESALSNADIFGRFDLPIFQAVLVYLTPQLVSEVSRSHSTFVAALIRHAQMAGLDKESAHDTDHDCQTKRHLWQHLLFLNARVTETVGPERTMVDDSVSLLPDVQQDGMPNNSCWFACMRYECYRIHRFVFYGRKEIHRGNITIPLFLQQLGQRIEYVKANYLDILDDRALLQKYTSLIGQLLLARAEGMFLQTQRPSWSDGVSNREMRQSAIRAALTIAECAVILETDPDLAPWSWYAGAYHQYHSTLALLIEIHQTPHIPEADRIGAVISHCFGPSNIATELRAGIILRAIRDNLSSFLLALGSTRQRNDEPLDDLSSLHIGTTEAGTFPDDPVFANFNLESSLSEAEAWWQWPLDMSQAGPG